MKKTEELLTYPGEEDVEAKELDVKKSKPDRGEKPVPEPPLKHPLSLLQWQT
jgi:hypothetical protein